MLLALLALLSVGGDPCAPRILTDAHSITEHGGYAVVFSRGAVDVATPNAIWWRQASGGALEFAIARCKPTGNGTSGWSNVPTGNTTVTDDNDAEPVVLTAEWMSSGIKIVVTTNCMGLGMGVCAAKHARAVAEVLKTFPKDINS